MSQVGRTNLVLRAVGGLFALDCKMPTFDLSDFEGKCAILECIANSYPDGSPEREAVYTAAQAMHYVSHIDTQKQFRAWVDSWILPPTALQVLHAKLAGIEELPHELMDETMREVEQLMERLRQKRT
jgi:hypothetical protein